MCCLPCLYPAKRQGCPGLTIWCCLPGPSERWTPSRRPFGGSICPCRHCCRTGALPSPSLPFAHPPPTPNLPKQRGHVPPAQVPRSGHRLYPRRWQSQGIRTAQGATALNAATSHPLPQSRGTEQGQPELPCEHHGSRPGWQGWICTKRREEERAKVELTYRWLFKSIKGR